MKPEFFNRNRGIVELLYENGIIATVLIIYGFFYLFFRLFSFIKATQSQSKKLFAMCIVTALMSFLFHTGITMHFYSKQTLYTLAFMIGLALPLILQLSNSGLKHTEKWLKLSARLYIKSFDTNQFRKLIITFWGVMPNYTHITYSNRLPLIKRKELI